MQLISAKANVCLLLCLGARWHDQILQSLLNYHETACQNFCICSPYACRRVWVAVPPEVTLQFGNKSWEMTSQGPVMGSSSYSASSRERNLQQGCVCHSITHFKWGLCGCSRALGTTWCSVGPALLHDFGIDQVSKAGGDLLEESTSKVTYLLFLAFN